MTLLPLSKEIPNGFQLHSPVKNTNNAVWLAFLQPCSVAVKAAEMGLTTIPYWINPRPLYAVSQLEERYYFPIVYDKISDALNNTEPIIYNKFVPFSKDYSVNQEEFRYEGESLSQISREARLQIIPQLTNEYFQILRNPHVLDKEEPLFLCKQVELRIFSSPVPFIFYGLDSGYTLWFNSFNYNKLSYKNYSSDGWGDSLNSTTSYTKQSITEKEKKELLTSAFTSPHKILGMKYKGEDKNLNNTNIFTSQFGKTKLKQENNLDIRDLNQPAFYKTEEETHLLHRSNTFFPGRSVFWSITKKTGEEEKESHRLFRESEVNHRPAEELDWIFWDSPDKVLLGKEFSKFTAESLLYLQTDELCIQNPLISWTVNANNQFEGKFNAYTESDSTIVETTERFNPINHKLSLLEESSEFILKGIVIEKDDPNFLKTLDHNLDLLFKEESYSEIISSGVEQIDFFRDIIAIETLEDDVFIDVSIPLSVYLSRIYYPQYKSQLQLSASLATNISNLPIGYIVPHTGITENHTYEALQKMHKEYGLAGFSKKQKQELFNDIVEQAHELSNQSFEDILNTLSEEDKLNYSESQWNPLTEANFLITKINQTRNDQHFLTDLFSILKGDSVSLSSITNTFIPWIGNTLKSGSSYLEDISTKESLSLPWALNLHILGRTRGSVLVNPVTAPMISFNEHQAQILHNIPKLPESTNNHPINLDETIYILAEETLWK